MSGILEQLMSKADVLIEALNENTKARLAGAGDAPAAAATAAEPAKRGRPTTKAKEEPASPKTTEAALVAKFEELKGTDTATRMPRLKKIIADSGFATLAELRQTPAKFDEVMTALEAYETELSASATADDDDL